METKGESERKHPACFKADSHTEAHDFVAWRLGALSRDRKMSQHEQGN
jgi:hypothetical protein